MPSVIDEDTLPEPRMSATGLSGTGKGPAGPTAWAPAWLIETTRSLKTIRRLTIDN